MAAQPLTNPERLERLLELLDAELGYADGEPEVMRDLTIAMRQLDGFVDYHAAKSEAEALNRRVLDQNAVIEEMSNRLSNLEDCITEVRHVIEADRDYLAQLLEGDRAKPLRDTLDTMFSFQAGFANQVIA